jgi:hypothetical protein
MTADPGSLLDRLSSKQKKGLIALVALALVLGVIPILRKSTSELPVYTTAAERLWNSEEIYRLDDAKPFTYPPFFAMPFLPLVTLSAQGQRAVWYFINLFVILAVIRQLSRWVRPHINATGPPVWLFWIFVALLAGRHVQASFENQSHDLLILGLVFLAGGSWLNHQPIRAGIWAGLAAACKATPLLFLLLFAVQRRWKAVIATLLAFVLASLLPSLFFSRPDGGLWAVSWLETIASGVTPSDMAAGTTWNPNSSLNQSLPGTTYRLLTPALEEGPFVYNVALFDAGTDLTRAISILAQLLVLGLMAWFVWPRPTRDSDIQRLGAVGTVLCGMVLLSPMSSKSHFCVLLLPLGLCIAKYIWGGWDRLLGILLLLFFSISTLTAKSLTGRDLGGFLLAHGTVTWAALLTLLAMGRTMALDRAAAQP